MRTNMYTSLDDFYYEYARGKAFSWQDENHRRRFMGIEFKFNDKYYRMCREPLKEEERPIISGGRKGLYMVVLVNDYWDDFTYTLIGWYENLDDVLANCYLDGVVFSEAIMDPDTEILAQD